MGEIIQLRFKLLTGNIETINISRNASVIDTKRQLHRKLADAPPHRQKLFIDYRAGSGTQLEDGRVLSSYPGISSGCTVVLIIKPPWTVYVQVPNDKTYEIDIPCNDPTAYTITDLKTLVENQMKSTMNDYQFQSSNGQLIEECRHGKRLTFKDCGINKEDTIFVMKVGRVLDISSPQIDICFLVDCTSSMMSWIESVKSNVKTVSDGLEKQYRGCDLQFAFVRYTDYDQPEHSRTTLINFTKSLSQFHGFVNPIRAIGGGDTAEDIMGGLKVTFSRLNWRSSAAKVLVHIADAPCHGSQYHTQDDTYPNGDPAGITHQQMMDEVVRLDIQYWFAYINKALTDQMVGVFNDYLKAKSGQRLIIRQVNATIPDELASTVHKSVTASVFANEARKKVTTATFDTTEPNWSSFLPQYGRKTTPPGPKSMQSLQEGFKPEKPSIQFSVKIASNPFAEGEESLIYRAYDIRNSRKLVLKRLKSSDGTLDSHMKVLEIQTIASTYANEFNIHKKKPSHLETIEFVPIDVAKMDNGTLYIVQVYIDGKFDKFNTNSGIVCTASPSSELMQAFSHFTFVHSGSTLLICDLQGVKSGHRFLLTDPAIHYRLRSGYYGSTDNGFVGIKRFFKSHTCNSICRQMELEGTKA